METRRAMILFAAICVAACEDPDPTAMLDLSVRTMEVGPDTARLVVGDTLRLTAYPKTADGQVLGGVRIDWETSDPKIATLRPKGIFPTIEARRAGGVVITATAEGKSGKARVTVVDSVARVELRPDTVALEVGHAVTLSATLLSAGGDTLAGRTVAWATSDSAVAEVSAGGVVTGVGKGTATIAATSEGKTGSAVVTVTRPLNPVPEALSLSPDSAIAGTGGFTLRVRGRNFVPGSRIHWNGSARETSFTDSTELRAVILPGDVASVGTATVTVWSPGPGGGNSNALSFEIVQVPVASVEIGPSHGGRLWPGETVQLTATARDADGNVLSGRSVTWAASDPDIARISPTGVVTGVAPGQASFTATVEGQSATARVDVIPLPAYDLLYESSRSGEPELWILSPGPDAEPRRLLPGVYAMDPAVSPDGRRIAYVGRDAAGNLDIYVVNRDGTGIRRLTSDPAVDDQPAWSPDGTRIAFRSLRSGYSDIWVMSADGSEQRNLMEGDYRAGTPASERPVWSPDGSRIVFQHRDAGNATSHSVLMTIRPDGSDVRVLSSLAADGFGILEPAFTPDGEHIVARTSHGQQGDCLALFGADGTRWYWYGEDPGVGFTPAISPDGLWIAYVSREQPGSCACEIFVTRMDAADRKMVTGGSAWGGGLDPVWIPRP